MINTSNSVSSKRKELNSKLLSYSIINDCISGQEAIKSKNKAYLPQPNFDDTSDDSDNRYSSYLARALFYNATRRTLHGLIGELFSRNPMIELPDKLKHLMDNADGTGLGITQLSKRAAKYVLSVGRSGLLVDYPITDGNVSIFDRMEKYIHPILTVYDPIDIINWHNVYVNGKKQLTLVVLNEEYDEVGDGFAVNVKVQQRVLNMDNGVYTVQIYRDDKPFGSPIVPKDHKGESFSELPFTFIGSENNDAIIDYPPLLDLANVNIGHYRNSADYEEGVFMTGQATPVFSGLTEKWVNDVLKGHVRLGSRGGIMLPKGGSSTLLQMQSNSAAFEAMEHKEKQMIALGAKMIENKKVERTATEANIDNNTEVSILSNVAKNVSSAITRALAIATRFTGEVGQTASFDINSDFDVAKLSYNERQQVLAEWMAGALHVTEVRAVLRKTGVATLSDDEFNVKLADNVVNSTNIVDEPLIRG